MITPQLQLSTNKLTTIKSWFKCKVKKYKMSKHCSRCAKKGKSSTIRRKKQTKSNKRNGYRKKTKTTSHHKVRSVRRKLPSVRRKSPAHLTTPNQDFTAKMGLPVENKKMCCQGSNDSGDSLQAALTTLCFDKDAMPTPADVSRHYDKCILQVDPEILRSDRRAEEFSRNVNAARFLLDSRQQ